MRRTQINIDEWQYQTLRARAEQQGRSISELVREILNNTLDQPRRKSQIRGIEGVGQNRSACGRSHDQSLYGSKGRK